MKQPPQVNQALQALTKLPSEASVKALSPAEVILAPSNTLAKINETLDLFVEQLRLRALEGSAGIKDIKALGELVKANATLRQTQLAEDAAAKSALSIESDEQVVKLLISALSSSPQALEYFNNTLNQLSSEGEQKAKV